MAASKPHRFGRATLPNQADDAGDDPVARAREAWKRLKADAHKRWEDWLTIGEALVIGRSAAMDKTSGQPGSRRYNEEFGNWLQLHQLDDIDKSDRAKLFLIMGDLKRIEKWRAWLTEGQRACWNHPSTVWRIYHCRDRGWPAMQRATASPSPRGKPGDIVPIAPTLTEVDGDPEVTEETLLGRLLVDTNKATGLAKDVRDFSGELNEALMAAVRDAAQAWMETLADLENRFHRQQCELEGTD